ncbi:MAG: beta-phosphoglucomutase family hydrolase [Prolixibacteraceae bacterium]|jgi:beta-phosphoglucomutase family hydrolase|nr:beta-phosphoglucomutase family hydrolase [Prolixibacteraceae bacterium]
MLELDIDPRAKALIFDLDGTITDSMPIHFVAWRNAVAPYGIDFTVELFEELAGIPVHPTVERLNEMFGTNMDPQTLGNDKEHEYELNMHRAVPIEPVVRLIKKFHGKLPMAVGTGSEHRLALKALDNIGLKDYFQIVVGYDDVKNHKPHPETFLKAAKMMGIEPRFCQVFEDGILGIQAAQTAGMMTTDVRDYYTVTIGKEVY